MEATELSQYTHGFKANLNLAPQQTQSKLLDTVLSDLNHSDVGTSFNADDVEASEPEDINTRVPKTPDKHLGAVRRVGFFRGFQDSVWLDSIDQASELTDPASVKMAALTAGRWRKADSGIIAALLGDTYEKAGEDLPATAVAFKASQVIAANYVGRSHQDETVPNDNSDFGLSIGKLTRAKIKLDDSDLDGERFFACTSEQIGDMLARIPATNTQYAEVKALLNGEISQFMGFTFKMLSKKRLLLKDGTTDIRRCVAWIKPALIFKARPIVNASVRIRHDFSDTPQGFYKGQQGGCRRYDEAVVEVQAKEPAE